MSVSGSGLARVTADPGARAVQNGYVLATIGGKVGRAALYAQHVGDTWYEYMTPDSRTFVSFTQQQQPLGVTIGSTVALGAGVVANYNGAGSTGTPIQDTCNWVSSAPGVATVNTIGDVTGISPGTATITCGRAGDGVYGASTISGWAAPGNVITLTVVNGGAGNTTWYVRPDGGTPFTTASATPQGQCDGRHDAAYPGTGVNQPCAVGNLNYLWLDSVTYGQVGWMIQGGDTVIVRQNPLGYSIGALAADGGWNCHGDTPDCHMPTIPSGTAARHTRILGENYASCHADSAKTKLLMNLGEYAAIDVKDSQFVDVSCFEITDTEQCAYGNYANSCSGKTNYGGMGILSTALTAQDTFSDLFIHGLAGGGWLGSVGTGVIADHLHLRASVSAGINMDDDPWGTGNISVAGGFAMTNSVTEFTGCVEEYPVVHNYPYIECRDQNTGGYGDGIGTASTSGDWLFDHDVWRYNFQDGLDLLHSGMHSLTVTNSLSYGNDGQQFKIGSGQTVVFANNLTLHNCDRILQTIGDEPASAIVPGVSGCRAAGDGIVLEMSGSGSDTFQSNTYAGYGSTAYDLSCEGGYDTCPTAHTTFQNNVNLAIWKPSYNEELPGLFYDEQPGMPANGGWAVRDHNLFYGFRHGCPTPLGAGEVCADPKLVGEPPLTLTDEQSLDDFSFALSAGSPARFAGVALPTLNVSSAGVMLTNVLAVDQFGTSRPNPPSMGGEEVAGSSPNKVGPVAATVTLTATPNPVVAGAPLTLTATVATVNGTVPTGSVVFSVGSVTTTVALDGTGAASAAVSSLAAGSYTATASYGGDSAYLAGQSMTGVTVSAGTVSAPAPPSGVTISVAQPELGFNVLPGSTRRLFATVGHGTTNGVTWTVKSGGASLAASTGLWVDVTAPATGSSCQVTKGGHAGVSSATQFVIEATSQDDPTQVADTTVNVCNPSVRMSVVPAYRTLYSGQQADLQSVVSGSVQNGVSWAIASSPLGGDGSLADSANRDTVFSATVAGRYVITATSVANQSTVAMSTLYVTGHAMPYKVTPNRTEPVDCTVDPSLTGVTYDVGPSQAYRRLQDVPLGSLTAGSTIRLHNEDTTGVTPTVFHEAIQITTSATADQPVRVCGVPDSGGNLPVMDGRDAVVHPDEKSGTPGLALIAVGGNAKFYAYPVYRAVQNIQIEGVHLRNAHTGLGYTLAAGGSGAWRNNASCLLVQAGHQISVIGVEMEGCATGGQSQWIKAQWNGSSLNQLWEGNYIHGNGVAGSSTAHQLEVQGWGEVVQFNLIQGMVKGSLGADLRSSGVQDVIRYNYLGDGAARLLDLTEVGAAAPYLSFADFAAESKTGTYTGDDVAASQEALHAEYVYGNGYVNDTTATPIHFGYARSGGETARKGELYWYNNTFVQAGCTGCDGQPWTLFDQSGVGGSYQAQAEFPTVQVFNNLIWMTGGLTFQWNDFDAFIAVAGRNLLPQGWGANSMEGGAGDGWNDLANAAAYQGASQLATHVTGFDGSNLLTAETAPLNLGSLLLNTPEPASTAVPEAICQMPVRYSLLPGFGLVIARQGSLNLGAFDTAGQIANVLGQRVGGLAAAASCQ